MRAMKKCPSCLGEVPAAASGCAHCPYTFPEEGEGGPGPLRNQQTQPAVLLVLGLGALVATGGFWAYRNQARPSQAVEKPRSEPVRAEIVKPASVAPQWKMRGVICDLVTLQPLGKAKVVFHDQMADARFETVTDASGGYLILLPPLSGRGYAVSIRRSGYSGSYLDPSVEDVPQLPRVARQKLAEELSGTAFLPALIAPQGSEPLVTRFYLAPGI